jgi:hypothetical protein
MAKPLKEVLVEYASRLETDQLTEGHKIHLISMLKAMAKDGKLPWVGLTDKERIECSEGSWAKTMKNVEALLKEKNHL